MAERQTFVQWKGTNLCMDLYCPACSEHSHFDGFFAYHVQCPHCGAVFRMPQDLRLERVEWREGVDLPKLIGEP